MIKTAIFLLLLTLFAPPLRAADWRTAPRDSAHLSPLPQDEKRAVVEIYAARAFGWRRYFAVHSWIAIKERDADHYTVYQVIGWRLRRNLGVVSEESDLPDRQWYGAKPELIVELLGERAETAIPKIKAAVKEYPYPNTYRAWPGPNSNTFVSYVLRRVPEFGVELPPDAIGKDWLAGGALFALSETHTGLQFSILGVCGFTAGLGDGLEINLLGMTFGVDFWRPALKLPFVGRIGLRDAPIKSAD